uniref:Uncharacterized protein n=1 Tax=Rhizophora mucronata TaxID=61149 RepID=A0A2P2KQR8_RHIMU
MMSIICVRFEFCECEISCYTYLHVIDFVSGA